MTTADYSSTRNVRLGKASILFNRLAWFVPTLGGLIAIHLLYLAGGARRPRGIGRR